MYTLKIITTADSRLLETRSLSGRVKKKGTRERVKVKERVKMRKWKIEVCKGERDCVCVCVCVCFEVMPAYSLKMEKG
jgi:hypothetical protein